MSVTIDNILDKVYKGSVKLTAAQASNVFNISRSQFYETVIANPDIISYENGKRRQTYLFTDKNIDDVLNFFGYEAINIEPDKPTYNSITDLPKRKTVELTTKEIAHISGRSVPVIYTIISNLKLKGKGNYTKTYSINQTIAENFLKKKAKGETPEEKFKYNSPLDLPKRKTVELTTKEIAHIYKRHIPTVYNIISDNNIKGKKVKGKKFKTYSLNQIIGGKFIKKSKEKKEFKPKKKIYTSYDSIPKKGKVHIKSNLLEDILGVSKQTANKRAKMFDVKIDGWARGATYLLSREDIDYMKDPKKNLKSFLKKKESTKPKKSKAGSKRKFTHNMNSDYGDPEQHIINWHLNELGKPEYTPLPRNEEKALAEKYIGYKAKQNKNKEIETRNKLIKSNLRFFFSVATNYRNNYYTITDLYNEAVKAAMKGIEKYDPQRGNKLISYLVWWARQGILQFLAEQSRSFNIPLNQISIIQTYGKLFDKEAAKLNRAPTHWEIVDKLNKIRSKKNTKTKKFDTLTEGYVLDALNVDEVTSLTSPFSSKENLSLEDVIPTDKDFSMEERKSDYIIANKVRETIDTLKKPIQREVIKLYYGIDHERNHTLEEIAAKYGLTRERIRQIKEKCIKELKHPTRNKELKEIYELIE